MKYIPKFFIEIWHLAFNERNNFSILKTDTFFGGVDISTQLDDFFRNSPEKNLFIIGAFGSGKTHQIANYVEKNKLKKVSYRSFFGVKGIESGYQHLLPIPIQLLEVIIISVLIYLFQNLLDHYDINIESSIYYSWMLIAFILLRNKLKVFYILGNIIRVFCSWYWIFAVMAFSVFMLWKTNFIMNNLWVFSTSIFFLFFLGLFSDSQKKEPVINIVDDLDRSSLNFEEQFALLSNLWQYKQQYVVLLGFNNEDQKNRTIEAVNKLNGKIILIQADEDVNEQIARSMDSVFPFNKNDWMNYIEPRALQGIITEVKLESELDGLNILFKKLFYLTKIIDYISVRLTLSPFDRQRIVYAEIRPPFTKVFKNLDLREPNDRRLRFTTATEQSQPLAMDIINKVYDSLSNDAEIKNLSKDIRVDQFATIFRFNMSKKSIFNLYGIDNFLLNQPIKTFIVIGGDSKILEKPIIENSDVPG
jgi:hypothetical protein